MNNMRKNFYVDANIFIFASVYPENDIKFKMAKKLLYMISENKVDALTSCLTWDELIWIVRKIAGYDIAKIEGSKMLDIPNLSFIDVNEKILREAQKIIENHNLKPRDAIHAASALTSNAEIISNDPDFDVIKELKRVKVEEFDKLLR